MQGFPDALEVVLAPGEALTEVDVHLTVSGSIQGRVTDTQGRPVSGALVDIRYGRGQKHRTSDDEGRVSAGGVPAGPCWIRATRDGSTSPWVSANARNNAATSVDLVLSPGGDVTAEVNDEAGPVENALIGLNSGAERTNLSIIVTNGTGSISAVPPGTYRVLATRDYRVKDGPSVVITTITVVGGEEQVVQFQLP